MGAVLALVAPRHDVWFNVNTVGGILLVVGAIDALISLIGADRVARSDAAVPVDAQVQGGSSAL